jgi:hypothetical protein
LLGLAGLKFTAGASITRENFEAQSIFRDVGCAYAKRHSGSFSIQAKNKWNEIAVRCTASTFITSVFGVCDVDYAENTVTAEKVDVAAAAALAGTCTYSSLKKSTGLKGAGSNSPLNLLRSNDFDLHADLLNQLPAYFRRCTAPINNSICTNCTRACVPNVRRFESDLSPRKQRKHFPQRA